MNQDLDIFTGLESLTDKSLIKQVETDTEPRFMMLETIREYALERLAESGEEEITRQHYAQFFLRVMEELEPLWDTPRQTEGLAHVDRDYHNLRHALNWAIDRDILMGLRLAVYFTHFCVLRGIDQEGLEWLTRALDRCPAAGTEAESWRAQALFSACLLTMVQGEHRRASAFGAQCLAIWRTQQDKPLIARILQLVGLTAAMEVKLDEARAFIEEGLTLYRELQDAHGLADMLWKYGYVLIRQQDYAAARGALEESIRLGQTSGNVVAITNAPVLIGEIVMCQGDYPVAQGLYEQGLQLARQHEISGNISFALTDLAAVLDMQGCYEQACAAYAEALTIIQKRGNTSAAAWQYSGLGRVALHQQQWSAARTHFIASLHAFQQHADQIGVAVCLIGFAGIAEGQGQSERAAHLLGAVADIRPKIDGLMYKEDLVVQRDYDDLVAAVRRALGEEAFAAALANGRAMTLEQAVELALESQQAHTDEKS